MVFAFALALLGRFGPTTDLAEIRDRVVGVLLGVFVSLAVSSLIWPEREGGDMRTNLAKLIESIAQLLLAGGKAVESPAHRSGLTRARTGSMALLGRNRELQTRVALEPTWLTNRNTVSLEAQTLLADAQEMLFSVDRAQTLLLHAEPTFPPGLTASMTTFRAALVQRLEAIAAHVSKATLLAADQSVDDAVALVGRQIDAIVDGSVSPQLLHDLRTSLDTLRERVSRLASHLERTVS
jgi:multidrug resistance protein MdtO